MSLRWVHGYLMPDPPQSLAEQAWKATTRASDVLSAVEARLVAAGAVIELRQFHGLSAQEVDVLLRLEREDQNNPALPSGRPQTAHATVAA